MLLETELLELFTELPTELVTDEDDLLEDDLLDDDGTDVPDAIEHSFTPPEIRAPNTASEHTNVPDKIL